MRVTDVPGLFRGLDPVSPKRHSHQGVPPSREGQEADRPALTARPVSRDNPTAPRRTARPTAACPPGDPAAHGKVPVSPAPVS